MNILAIEDDQPLLKTLKELLELHGHRVTTASDGESGVEMAKTGPDIILCDVNMPGMDGYQVIQAIQGNADCREIPFIFLTARLDRPDQRRGMTLGADDYLTKPFSEKEVLECIAACVRRKQSQLIRIKKLVSERRHEIEASWSHELITPLVGVMGALEILENETDTIKAGELKELLGLIRGGAERQLGLSRKLIVYFELERQKSRAPGAYSCEASAAIRAGVAKAIRANGRRSAVDIRCTGADVPVSDTHLATALAELVDNSCHFSAPGDAIHITGEARGGRYVITVKDQGVGMSGEDIERIGAFVQFNRRELEQQGLGLGLAICRSIAELASGSLRVDSEPGKGTRVTIDLPLM